jgi:large subunit ribosomal protein L10
MSREKKVEIVSELKEAITNCNIAVLTDYRGLSASELTSLRGKLRESAVEYRVVKNTLARLAVEEVGKGFLTSSFDGPVAIAFGYGDVTEPAKALLDYIHSSKSILSIKGGFLGDRLLDPGDITTLSKLPQREELLSQVLAGMQSPVVSLLNLLNNPLRGFMGVLQARIKQLEEG